jgi:molybdopterin-containing oxidoreductase family iron-sulfur binding subunit
MNSNKAPAHEKLFREGGEFGPMPAEVDLSLHRRDFVRLAGFAIAGAAVAGCQRAQVQYAVPLLGQPEELIPGRSLYYASACGGCSAGCGLLVKSHDGRPIKLEGNPAHPLSRGGLCAVGQASLLGLYDSHRLKEPLKSQEPAQWGEIDAAIRARLEEVRERGKPVIFLTGPLVSPTAQAQIAKFLKNFPGSRHVVFDGRFATAVLSAHARTHGMRVQPHYHLDKARVLVAFDADFLGGWMSPVEFTAAYQSGRRPGGDPPSMSYHVQFESRLSLTGSKADQRFAVRPDELDSVVSHLATRLAKRTGMTLSHEALREPPVPAQFLDHLVDVLWENKGRSLVLCAGQDVNLHVLTNFLNYGLENYGSTIDLARPGHQVQGNDEDVAQLVRDVSEGKVGALFTYACNPVHNLPDGELLAEAIRQLPLVVALSERLDETAGVAGFVCPVPHYLETWGDAEPVDGLVSIAQPAITPLGNTRSILESLEVWSTRSPNGQPRSAYDLVRAHWEAHVFPRRQGSGSFETFWNQTLHDGVASVRPVGDKVEAFRQESVRIVPPGNPAPADVFSLILYFKVGMPDAAHAYNPWLHELPDPISKVTWDNYACLSPATATRLGVKDGDVIRLEVPAAEGTRESLELPALVQPGQHDQVVAVALGYGSRLSGRFASLGPPWLHARPSVGPDGQVGKNAAPLLHWVDGSVQCRRDGVRLAKTGKTHDLAATQEYQHLVPPANLAVGQPQPRMVVRETTLAAHQNNNTRLALPLVAPAEDLWQPDHATEPTDPTAQWGMVIDQNACTGCSACVIACQAENNIPVVGKDEVRRHREMHWLRIDRYYMEHEHGVDVAHQPMLCQHCEHAPCEPVCPVLATVHSAEGLNQQVYNRCVGTRYCANNCPYKVRRFNWFNYAHEDTLQNLALNPNVTVRSRGVMEKCTFCVQRIQEAKSEAIARGKPLQDGELQTACQQSCPAQAITFGDLTNPKSRVAQQSRDSRGYRVLEELNVRPRVRYLTRVRNRPVSPDGGRHG